MKPPDAVMVQFNRMPQKSYAMVVMVKGMVENAEYCVWDRDGHYEELWKARKRILDSADHRDGQCQYWVKEQTDIYRINLTAPTPTRIPGQ